MEGINSTLLMYTYYSYTLKGTDTYPL